MKTKPKTPAPAKRTILTAEPPHPPLPPNSGILSLIANPETQKTSQALIPVSAPASPEQFAALIQTKPSAPTEAASRRKHRRHGRVASLPKTVRDMVNRMISNGVPYKNIVHAVDEAGYTLTERNVSNWATGGYMEWQLEQEIVTQNRLDQDHLTDFLRRDDATELPEVGLQAAATRLSQHFIQKLARAEDPEAHIDSYNKLVDILCRLNREIAATQKARDDSRRALGPEFNPDRIRNVEQLSAIEHERFFSDPPDDADLPKPVSPPLLPAIPTSSFLADRDSEKKHEAELARLDHQNNLLRAVLGKAPSPSSPATPPPSDEPSS